RRDRRLTGGSLGRHLARGSRGALGRGPGERHRRRGLVVLGVALGDDRRGLALRWSSRLAGRDGRLRRLLRPDLDAAGRRKDDCGRMRLRSSRRPGNGRLARRRRPNLIFPDARIGPRRPHPRGLVNTCYLTWRRRIGSRVLGRTRSRRLRLRVLGAPASERLAGLVEGPRGAIALIIRYGAAIPPPT